MNTFDLPALAIDKELERGVRLKSAATADKRLIVGIARSLEDAETQIAEAEDSFSVLFISASFSSDEVREFISKAKKLRGGEDGAYVFVCDSENSNPNIIASRLTDGFDGFLQEPFSASSMQEVVDLADRLTKQRREERMKMVVQVALVDVLTFIDVKAARRKRGTDSEVSSSALEQLQRTLKAAYDVDSETYFQTIADAFVKLAEQKDAKNEPRQYTGASERVKKRMRKRALERQQRKAKEKLKGEES